MEGAKNFKKWYHGNKQPVAVFLDVSNAECSRRMAERGDGALAIAQRLNNDRIMFFGAKEYLQNNFEHSLVLYENAVPELARMIASYVSAKREES